jgi:hypothetical protein
LGRKQDNNCQAGFWKSFDAEQDILRMCLAEDAKF